MLDLGFELFLSETRLTLNVKLLVYRISSRLTYKLCLIFFRYIHVFVYVRSYTHS